MLHDPRGVEWYRTDESGTPLSENTLRARYRDLLDRLDSVEPEIHAYLPEQGRTKRVLAELDTLFARYPDPSQRPPLFAVPLGVKDLFRADGFETRAGSQLPPETFAGKQAQSVSRLRAAGAIVIGKTVTTEFAYFTPGPTANPWNTAHTPGGSSSGSAAAVSACTAAIALGTQTIGSINRPASFCGVVGFKPSYGRVPEAGVVPFSPTADHVGVLTANVASARAAAAVLWEHWNDRTAGPPATAGSANPPSENPGTAGRLTFILLEDAYTAQADAEMRTAIAGAAGRLEAAGYRVVREALLDDIDEINQTHNRMIAREFADVHAAWFAEHASLYSPRSRELVERGNSVSDQELREAIAGRDAVRTRVDELLTRHGAVALLTPSAPGAAPAGLQATGSPLLNLPWTYAGVPTVTLRAGVGAEGLPLGLQLVGASGGDERVLAVAESVERVLGPVAG